MSIAKAGVLDWNDQLSPRQLRNGGMALPYSTDATCGIIDRHDKRRGELAQGLDRVDSVPPERRRDHGTDADRRSDTYRVRAIASSLERRPHRTHTLASDTVLLRWCVEAAAAGIVRDHQCLHPFCGLETQLARLFAHEMSSSTVSGGVVDEGAWRFRQPHRRWQHAPAVIRSDRAPLRRPRRGLRSIGQSGNAVDRGTARDHDRDWPAGEHEAQRDLDALISGSEGSAPEPRR